MPSLDDALVNNAAAVLDDIGDSTTYTPKVGGVSITRSIIFTREDVAEIPGTPSGRAASVIAEIADDATYGVTSITFGGDKVVVPTKFGGGGKAYDIADFIDRSGGWWRVRIYISG